MALWEWNRFPAHQYLNINKQLLRRISLINTFIYYNFILLNAWLTSIKMTGVVITFYVFLYVYLNGKSQLFVIVNVSVEQWPLMYFGYFHSFSIAILNKTHSIGCPKCYNINDDSFSLMCLKMYQAKDWNDSFVF